MIRLDIIEGWQALAEQRLAYLSELFETGRWRRYHTEAAFLENFREAKSAVETWRVLLAGELSPDNSKTDLSRPDDSEAVPQLNQDALSNSIQGPELSEDTVLGRGPDISAVKQRYPLLYDEL
jgi:uncharacterized repeat protein (TIGR03809 family)